MPEGFASLLTGSIVSSIDSSYLSKHLTGTFNNIARKLSKPLKKIGKSMDKTFGEKRQKGIKRISNAFLNGIGMFLQLSETLGILEPIIKIISGFFQIMGGAAMQSLAPALSYLAEKFKDPEFIEALKHLGEMIGKILGGAIMVLADIIVIVIKALDPFLQLLGTDGMIFIVKMLAKVVGVLIIGALVPLITVIYGIGVIIAAIMDVFTGGVNKYAENWTKDYANLMGGIASGVIEIMALQHGGYVAPSVGGSLVTVAEGGEGEFVIPESKMESVGMTRDVLWATEDNGEKLDKIYYALMNKGRLR